MKFTAFESEILSADPLLADHPLIARRCIALMVRDYDAMKGLTPKQQRKRLRRLYGEEFGFIELIIIGIIVQLIVKAIVAWWNNREASEVDALVAGWVIELRGAA